MATRVVMPPLGDSSDEATLLKWLKKEGDPVQKGENILEIETDKVTLQIEAYGSGVLRKIIVAEGETVGVGMLLGIIAAPDEDISGVK